MNFFNNGCGNNTCGCQGGCDICSIVVLMLLLQCCGCGCQIDPCTLIFLLLICGCGNNCCK